MVGDAEKSMLLCPPPLPLDGKDHNAAEQEQPSWVLLDLQAYVADRKNSTSACSVMSDGLPIRVTLCAAPPPLVSYLCVWCPDQKPDETPHIKRCVVEAADADLAFLYVSHRSLVRGGPCDCFIYKASNGDRGPSLRRIKFPKSYMSSHHEIAVLPLSDVVVRPQADGGGGRFRLFPDDEDEIVVFSPDEDGGGLEDSVSFPTHEEGGSAARFFLRLSPHAEDGGKEEDVVSLHRRYTLRRHGEGVHHQHTLRRHGEGDSDFCVALLKYKGSSGAEQHKYELCVYHSTDEQWRRTPFSISHHRLHLTYKAINLGQGGLVGFVDPWRGIIVCDVHGRRPACYLPLPAELIVDDDFDMPLLYRDIALVEGTLTLVDLCDIGELDTVLNRQAWEASTWSRKVTDLWEEDWSQDYVVNSGDVSVMDAADSVDLLPKVLDDDGTIRPTVELPYMAHPTVSLSDNHVVYVMGKLGYLDQKVLVMAVDMKEQRLQAVTMFDNQRMVGIPFNYSYIQSRIPKYFKPDVGENLKRPGMFCTTYPRKLHALGNETYMEILGGVPEQHETGSSKGAKQTDNSMDVD